MKTIDIIVKNMQDYPDDWEFYEFNYPPRLISKNMVLIKVFGRWEMFKPIEIHFDGFWEQRKIKKAIQKLINYKIANLIKLD